MLIRIFPNPNNVFWGSILGDISIQSDLQTELINADSKKWIECDTNMSLSANRGYICNSSEVLELSLPTIATLGATIEVVAGATANWRINQTMPNQQIFSADTNTTLGTSGNLLASSSYASVKLLCISKTGKWVIISHNGDLDFN
jgi:hypothetical protein